MSTSDTDQFHDLLDHWENLREQGQEPCVEELCRDAPHLTEKMREWVRVLKMSEWMCKRADDVADETFGEAGKLSAEERSKHQVIGEYTILEELGSGGMGRVFKAVHRKMNRQVALKLLPPSLMPSPESIARFDREIQALAKLSHPNIVSIHDAGEAEGAHFYVMDLVDGNDLARLVKENGPMPVEQAIDCILQAARGLECAHAQGIVHRDIKPSNLILDQGGTVKILDLGIARFQPTAESSDDLTKTGCVLGTVDYMPPEQALNTRSADHRADIYSLGCTLWFLLTRQSMFAGDTVMERIVAHRGYPVPSLQKACPAAPPWLDALFRKMVAKKPDDRYQSVTALISDLTQRSAPRNGWWLKVAAAIVSLLLLAGLSFLFHGETTQEKPRKTDSESTGTNNAEAILVDGKHLCFMENKWAQGLPLLAKCGDVELRKLATADMEENASTRDRLRLGDRWWDFAGNEVGAVWKGSQMRAAYWYRRSVPVLPRRRAEVEKRLKDIGEQPPGFEVVTRRAQVFPDDSHGIARSTNLLLEVIKNETTSDGAVFAGLELKGVRYLTVAVNASQKIERLAHLSFAGFIIDYRTGSDYVKRVALGIDTFDKRKRKGEKPLWGKHDAVDEYVDLGRHALYELDLQQWAPSGWDGQMWFTVALQHVGLGTAVTAQLMPLTKQQEPKPATGETEPENVTHARP
ncbi:MAG: serine/threonine-protein kinase [Planctomycetota bacterium]